MTGCEQVEELLATTDAARRGTPPESIRAHLDRCPPCRKIWQFAAAREPADVPREVRGCIEQRLKESLHPVRPLPCRNTRTAVFLAIFLAGAGFWASRTSWRGAEGMTVLQLAGTLAAVALAAGLVAVVLSREMSPGEKRIAPLGTMALVIVGGIAVPVLVLFPWDDSGAPWLSAAARCQLHGAVFALPVAVVALLVVRRGAALCPGTAGAAIGLLSGLAAMATLHVACARLDALHIAAGHLSLPVGGALVGFLAGKAVGLWTGRSRGAFLKA